MASLPELARYNVGQSIQYGEAGQKRRTLADLGQYAAAGDYRGAQAAAFAGGETELGLRLKQMNDEDKQRLVGQAASWAYEADTPEKWEQGRQMWEQQGYDPGPFQARDTLLSQALSVQDRMTEAYRQQQLGLERQKVAQAGATGGGVFGTPIYGKDPETGEAVLGAIGKDGTFHRLDTGGVQVTPGVTWQDLGTYRQGFDKSGAPVTPQVAIDNSGRAADTASGKAEGEALASYRSMASKLPGLQKVVADLKKLANEATYTAAGQLYDYGRAQLGMEPREAAVARTKYMAVVDNQILPLLRDTFGAQFTEREGVSLRATLGDPNKTPTEKNAVLDAFISQKIRDVEAMALQSMPGPASGTGGAPPGRAGGGWTVEPAD